MNEKNLIKKCLRGDREAFDRLIRLYYDYVYGFLLKTTRNKELTEDITQETFLKAVQNIEKFDCSAKASFGTWLVTIARHSYIDCLRKRRISFSDTDDISLKDETDIAEEIERKIQCEEIAAAAKTLPQKQEIVIRLKYSEGLTTNEIAERLGIEPKTVKSRIHDATVKLRKMLGVYYLPESPPKGPERKNDL